MQHRTVLIIFHLILQTVIVARMMSTGGQELLLVAACMLILEQLYASVKVCVLFGCSRCFLMIWCNIAAVPCNMRLHYPHWNRL